MMRWEVTAQLIGHDGEAIWGYSRTQVVPPPRPNASEAEITEGFLAIGAKVLDSIDEAKETVSEQIRAEGVEPS